MKVSNTVSTLACLALLSTYSVNGFAKTGNGDSYSGPTLSGVAVALTSDKAIMNSQLTKVISSCLVQGGEKSYLSQIITSFYGNKFEFAGKVDAFYGTQLGYPTKSLENGGYYHASQINYFNLDKKASSHGAVSTSIYNTDLLQLFRYKAPDVKVSDKSKWLPSSYTVSSEIRVAVSLTKDGILKIDAQPDIDSNDLPRNRSEAVKNIMRLRELNKDRFLIVENLPIFSADTKNVDIFDEVNGDYKKTEIMLQNLKMVYDRNEKAPYSQVLNGTGGRIGTTQFMAPNAEFADCVTDQLGRL